MLHHRDMRNCGIEYTDRKALLRMLCESENISEDKIKIIDEPRYIKYYKDSFEEAINNSKLLETEPTNLLRNNGTNVGLKLKSLLE